MKLSVESHEIAYINEMCDIVLKNPNKTILWPTALSIKHRANGGKRLKKSSEIKMMCKHIADTRIFESKRFEITGGSKYYKPQLNSLFIQGFSSYYNTLAHVLRSPMRSKRRVRAMEKGFAIYLVYYPHHDLALDLYIKQTEVYFSGVGAEDHLSSD